MSPRKVDLKSWMMPLIASGNKVTKPGLSYLEKAELSLSGPTLGPYGLLQHAARKTKLGLSCNRALPKQGLSLCIFQLFTWKCSKQASVTKHNGKLAGAIPNLGWEISSGLV